MNKLNKILVLQKKILPFIAFLILGFINNINAQDRVPFDQGTKYFLANVDVTGKLNFNAQTVVTFAGLEKGQQITVPGEEISNAIKKLAKLGLFKDIDFYTNKVVGDSIFLELNINELPKLGEVKFVGVKKGKIDELIKENNLTAGKVVNENLITTTKYYLENKYKKDGFFNTKVTISTKIDTASVNDVKMLINIDKGEKIKISNINISGNQMLSAKKVRSAMSDTKQINPIRFWKSSKFIKEKYNEDLIKIVDEYKSKGYRDARIISDSVYLNQATKKLAIDIKVDEGRKYYFGNIKFIGNTVYSDRDLQRMIGLQKGDTYNGVELAKRIADKSKPDGDDITNLYQNTGYLFSNINPVEVKTANDSIDFEIRINEGPIAYFNKITVVGNDKTNDEIIYRELRTKPGQKYSKEQLVRTIRELGQLGFFDPEAIKPDFKNVDANNGTVDIQYNLVEKGASQIELQGGYGGSGFVGTLGLSFNNFSVRNLFKKEAYKPLPMGDGQKLALRLQASQFFQTFSLSFSEPWFGGKKPIQFSSSLSQSKQFSFEGNGVNKDRSFNITSLSIGLAKRLSVPDDYFVLSNTLSFQYYDLNNYNVGLFTFGNGSSRNLSFTTELRRNNKGINPIFPIYGSEFSVSAKFTPPFSLFTKLNLTELGKQPEYKQRYTGATQTATLDGITVQNGDFIKTITNSNGQTGFVKATAADADVDQSKIDQKQFNWLEYYKVKFKADWFTKIYGNLVFRSLGEFGFLGRYDSKLSEVPFERFYLGGDGLANFALDGREIVGMRGYQNQSLTPTNAQGSAIGGTIYNKYSLELRYPITLKAAASIYALTFAEAGASYRSFKDYNPFAVQRSAGIGLRIFMPAFGLLGIDFAHGFDPTPGTGETGAHGWETHFIIGQQF